MLTAEEIEQIRKEMNIVPGHAKRGSTAFEIKNVQYNNIKKIYKPVGGILKAERGEKI